MNKFTIGVIIAIVAVFGGLVIYNTVQNNNNAIDYSKYDASKIITDTSDTGGIAEHVRGNSESKVVVVEYADFQCPGCASMMPKIDAVYEEYKDDVAFVFRNYPISYHQNARAASAAGEAAALQGYFWEMADALYNNRTDWMNETGQTRTDRFVELFKSVAPEGDDDKFKDEMEHNENFEKKINFDIGIGRNRSGVEATPSFYVNGSHIEIGENDSLDDFAKNIKNKIDEELKK